MANKMNWLKSKDVTWEVIEHFDFVKNIEFMEFSNC